MPLNFNGKSTADQVLEGIDLTGRRILVTGVASGIGLETARSLVAKGAHVVGTVRSLEKAGAAVDVLRGAATGGSGSFIFIEIDLASLKSVRATAEKLSATKQSFSAVIANAGVMATPHSLTEDGFETQFATNHLGHFALITEIAPLIEENGRVVVLSSQVHRVADVDLVDPNFEHQDYDAFVAYGRSKTANALFAVAFDRRHRERGIRATSVMPGNSLTDLPRNFSEEQLQGLFATVGKAREEAGLPPAELKTVAQAAATPVWAAILADGDEIGGHYLEDCAVAPVNDLDSPFADGVRSYALDVDTAEALWQKSEALVRSA
ncbi:shikimate dehydrogenase [Rhizobium sp. Root274]|uniref:SDR family NAD(P)-dependent oxidoreductase n=1 Tax=unclassified Rhizobium TaxID=2613769 RepID=UPI0007158A68|nr:MULTISPECIES: SDR family NAD(P)-dependent oxidoreductase [unclassified Rhizobium]KQW26459.1 shikimate dehydrogenase [Rhizobium sp. Root1240]KRD26394.1 shikimate dehydrogenase [Rhizobium sp. Root274]